MPGKLQVMETRPCPACTANASRRAGSANGHGLARRARCGTLFTVTLLLGSAGEAMDYAGYYHASNLDAIKITADRPGCVSPALAPKEDF